MQHLDRIPNGIPAQLRARSSVFWTEDNLRFADLDANAHVSNRAFCEILENGRMALIRRVIGPLLDPDMQVVIARLSVDFHRQLRFPGKVWCGTWISRFGSSSFNLGQVLVDAEGVPATGSGICVISRPEDGHAAPIPERLRRLFEEAASPDLSTLYTRNDGRDYAHQRIPADAPPSAGDGDVRLR